MSGLSQQKDGRSCHPECPRCRPSLPEHQEEISRPDVIINGERILSTALIIVAVIWIYLGYDYFSSRPVSAVALIERYNKISESEILEGKLAKIERNILATRNRMRGNIEFYPDRNKDLLARYTNQLLVRHYLKVRLGRAGQGDLDLGSVFLTVEEQDFIYDSMRLSQLEFSGE